MDIDAFRTLLTPYGERLLADATTLAGETRSALATATALRRDHPPELVAAALTQVELRARAGTKFGDLATVMYFTPDGLEAATRPAVAEHRAARYRAAGVGDVLDLACGIGGDLLALAGTGLTAAGVDRDPLTVEVARANAAALSPPGEVTVRVGDVAEVDLTGRVAAFVDPARRAGGRRVFDPAAYSPPFGFLTEVADRVPYTGAKVGPGIGHDLVPAGAEAEWVSDRGEVTEAALWWGPLATARRRATLLPGAHTLAATADPEPPPVAPPAEWLYEPDGAVIRAGLVALVAERIGGWALDPAIAYLSAPVRVDTPFARGYRVTDVLGFSVKRLRALLRSRDVGTVTVKKRGSAVDPEALRRQLRLTGDPRRHVVVVLTRLAGTPTVLLCEPPAARTVSTT